VRAAGSAGEVIRSKVFNISRTQLARAASGQYLRRMWPIFLGFPIFGLVAILFGPDQLIRAIGCLAFIWPFSIPARVILASWGKARVLMRPTWVSLEEGVVYFHDDAGGGMKLPLDQVRRVDKRGGFYVFETRRFNFALVPVDAFDAETGERFDSVVMAKRP
jgi:hypothetical protein